MGLAYTNTRRVRDAIAALEQMIGASPPISQLIGTSLLAAHYENLGELEKAASYLARLDASDVALIRDVGLAVFHMVRANFEESAVCLGEAIDKRNPWASLSATWLIAGFADSEPGRAIKKRINLT
jgi:tetratricopeptide (TPR) repeat protein